MRSVACLMLAGTLVACGDARPLQPPDGRPPVVQVLARNLRLEPGEANAIRIAYQPATPTTFVRPDFDDVGARVSVCALPSVEAPIDDASCERDLPNGVRHPVPAPGARALAIVSHSAAAVRLELFIEFDEAGRRLAFHLPEIAAPADRRACADNACNPLFEVIPTRGGAFSAAARWEGPDAVFVLLQGSVRGRAQTATGIPYREPARAEGASPLDLSTRLTARDEYALVLRHPDAGPAEALRNVVIEAGWP